MSTKYPGGIISKTAPVPSGPYANSTAPGIWTLEQQAALAKQGNWPTAGNVDPNAFIENLFSTYLYTGTGASLTITNGINLSGNGGLVWQKDRPSGGTGHYLQDTVRGVQKYLLSNTSDAEVTNVNTITAFNSNGYTVGGNGNINGNGEGIVSWTFREQAKFFDIVTFSGNGSSTQTISHNLGSVPGCMIVKGVSGGSNWPTYHRSMDATPQDYYMILDGTGAKTNAVANWGNTAPTSTQFTVGGNNNVNGYTYVAYLFAHNAGGFGLTGTDNVISCDTFTSDGSGNATVNLGYEPQWILIKKSNAVDSWYVIDNMRGWSYAASSTKSLSPNDSSAEVAFVSTPVFVPTATGFTSTGNVFGASQTYIYIAIRRGPMAVPTVGTSVYNAVARTGTGATATVSGVGFSPDLAVIQRRPSLAYATFIDRLRGAPQFLTSADAGAEYATPSALTSFNMDGVSLGTDASNQVNPSGITLINWFFKRAPSVFDEVCYSGTGSATNFSHNLGVTPQLIILKSRSSAVNWYVMYSGTSYMILNNANAGANSGAFDLSLATASTFYLGSDGGSGYNGSGSTYVAYLFATAAGVSKVGSYTGTGALQTVNCGFAAGARFVLIKRTDSTGDWYVYDTTRGMTSGNDPYLLLNSTAAEVTGTNYVDTTAVGFQVTAAAPAGLNANGGTYIFLAIA
jgi:hypothetical protein